MEWITVPEKGFTLREVRTLTNRNVNLSEELEKSVSAILEKVRDGGDAAIRELTKKFDGVELSDFRVTEEEMQALIKAMDGENGDLLLFAADKNTVVWATLGALRLELARQMELLNKEEYKFLWVTEFPLLEWSE